LRSDLFEVVAMPRSADATVPLPLYVAPTEGEALRSWVARLGAALGLSPNALGRDAFGVDGRSDPEWWRRPDADTLIRIARRTGIDPARLEAMTLIGWSYTGDDEQADRFAARRWRKPTPKRTRGLRLDVCIRCVADDPRSCVQLIWMLGWAGVCPRHRTVLTSKCPACATLLRAETPKADKPVDLLACRRCGARLAADEVQTACVAALTLQDALIVGKRSGTTQLPGIGALDWRTTVALADVLLGMVWADGSDERRRRLFARIGTELDLAGRDRAAVVWTGNYGGLVILAWLLEDLAHRLPAAIGTLCAPRLDRLLGRVPNLDEATSDHLRTILASAAAKPREGYRAWRPRLDGLRESAADLRARAARDRYKHRRQRLTAFAAMKDGTSVPSAAAIVGVAPKTLYRWLHRGATAGLDAALERPTGRPALSAYQAETLAQWIVSDRLHQTRRAIRAHAAALFGVALNADAASKLLAKHGRAKPGHRRRLWGPRHGPRQTLGSTHDPAPGP